MNNNKPSKNEIIEANKVFYNFVSSKYEEIDGRRSPALFDWVKAQLLDLRKKSPDSSLLDIGTGCGFVSRCGEGIFDFRVGMDISSRIVSESRNSFDFGIAAEIGRFPFKNESFGVVSCFSTLHHLFEFQSMISEVFRVLIPGGIFYSDHDMDTEFSRKFGVFLRLYRAVFNQSRKIRRLVPPEIFQLFHLSEYQNNGIDSLNLGQMLKKSNFEVHVQYHWFGLTSLLNFLFGTKAFNRGWAPLAKIVARKKL